MGQSWHEQWRWEPDVGVGCVFASLLHIHSPLTSQPAHWVEINPRAKVQTLEFEISQVNLHGAAAVLTSGDEAGSGSINRPWAE